MSEEKINKMSSEKAEILGLLCAEGTYYRYYSTYYEFFKNRGVNGKYYRRTKMIEAVEFTNLNEKLLQHFRSLMFKVYRYAPRPTGIKTSIKIRIKKASVIQDLLKHTKFGCKKWRVPKELWNSENGTISSFIRGLFDGDGTIRKFNIRLSSINPEGLKGVNKLLRLLGIVSWVKGPYSGRGNRKPNYYLYIPRGGVKKYKELINSNHINKRKILNALGDA